MERCGGECSTTPDKFALAVKECPLLISFIWGSQNWQVSTCFDSTAAEGPAGFLHIVGVAGQWLVSLMHPQAKAPCAVWQQHLRLVQHQGAGRVPVPGQLSASCTLGLEMERQQKSDEHPGHLLASPASHTPLDETSADAGGTR